MTAWRPRTLIHPDGVREWTPSTERAERDLIMRGYRVKPAEPPKVSIPRATTPAPKADPATTQEGPAEDG